MDDIRKEDRRLFVKELLDPMRIMLTLAGLAGAWVFVQLKVGMDTFGGYVAMVIGLAVVLSMSGVAAYNNSVPKRWRNKRTQALWQGCQERLTRFDEVLTKTRKDQIADLNDMPRTIKAVGESLYAALRRADLIADEVQQSERGLYNAPPTWQVRSNDPQSNELYRLADKNIAEYKAHFASVMAGVQRTEAQSAVFMTTLDTLRMKMLGYRLVGRSPELSSHEFLEALAEARAQLQSIDTALEELDLSHYPTRISVVPTVDGNLEQQIDQR